MDLLGRVRNGMLETIRAVDPQQASDLSLAGFAPVVFAERPPQLEALEALELTYEQIDGVLFERCRVVPNAPSAIEAAIDRLKRELTESDYKVLKCYETSLGGGAMPYDLEELIGTRVALRGRINELEALL